MSLVARVRLRRDAFELDVDVTVDRDETVAVLGPNGSGKTTFLHALAGLVPLDAGRVTLDGVVLEDVAEGVAVPTERRPVAVVFQHQLLFPHLSALENVAFGLHCRGRPRGEARRIARAWLERMDLGDRARACRGARVSGSRWRARWQSSRGCCSSTSPSPRRTCRCARSCDVTSASTWPRSAASACW
jgi:molybdate transport system ATP-binding protein